jgi:uncharacterized phage protein gp47/JayE
MPEIFGLTEQGFKAKDFTAIKNDLEAELRREVDPDLHFGEGSVAGILTAIVANQARQVWEVAQGLYHSLQPHTATGLALDALCSITGTYRRKAAYSRAKAMVTLDSKMALPKDSRIQTINGHLFKVTAEVRNKEPFRADIEADLIAEDVGPINASAKTVAKIMTPVAGWSKAVITHIYETGRFDETDDELRLRRIAELRAHGSSTAQAIRARLMSLDHVEAVHIKESAQSFEVIIKGGKDEEIAQTIWQCKPLGVETSGTTLIAILDSLEQYRTIRFSRPHVVHYSLQATLKVKKLLNDGELDALKNTLVDFGVKHFKLGAKVYPSRFYGVMLDYPHVADVINLELKERLSEEYTTMAIRSNQIASLAFSDIHLQQTLEAVP